MALGELFWSTRADWLNPSRSPTESPSRPAEPAIHPGSVDAVKPAFSSQTGYAGNLPSVTSLCYRGEADDGRMRYLSMIGASQQLHHRRKQRTRLLRRVLYPYPLRESNSRCQIESLVS